MKIDRAIRVQAEAKIRIADAYSSAACFGSPALVLHGKVAAIIADSKLSRPFKEYLRGYAADNITAASYARVGRLLGVKSRRR